MRFLLDMGISPRVLSMLRELSHDVVRCSEVGLSTATDSSILEYALTEGRVLISTDLDFADLTVDCGVPCPGLILFRLDNPSAEVMCTRLQIALTALRCDEIEGCVVVIQPDRLRTRKL